MFIHDRTRLFCELHRAQKWLTQDDFLTQWLPGVPDNFEVTDIQPREKVVAVWKTIGKEGLLITERLEFHMMPCASRTQYCTEIHLMIFPDPREVSDQEDEGRQYWRRATALFWKDRLEALRRCVNGDWVIEDKDLNRSILLRSRL
jgi:hypothetical protein